MSEATVKPSYRFLAIVAGVGLILDQITKWWALSGLTRTFIDGEGNELGFGGKIYAFLSHDHPRPTPSVSVVDSFWHFTYAQNPGAAFSFMRGASEDVRLPFLLGIAVVACIGVVWYYRRVADKPTQWALALILSGAVGNFFDRVRFGYVIDFIDWHLGSRAGGVRVPTWPTFNIADVWIVVGVGLMVLQIIREELEKRGIGKAKGNAQSKTNRKVKA